MQKSVLEAFPDVNISLSIVWIEMLPTDGIGAARKMAAGITDSRVRHFHDPRPTRRAGKALAEGLLYEGAGPAWDVYLFFDQKAEWTDHPPKPVDWVHQLAGGKRADPKRFHPGAALESRLHEIMHDIAKQACKDDQCPYAKSQSDAPRSP